MATETAIPRTRGNLTPLCELAEKHGTDKLGLYTPIYDLLLSGRRDRVFKVLEVGVGTPEAMKHVSGYKAGASLRMWRDYFPNAEVCGIDINPNACKPDHGKRIRVYCANSTDPNIVPLLAWGGNFDLIVDDGEHVAKTQIETFHNLSPLLAPHGLYIIEDAKYSACLPEHTQIGHVTKFGTAEAILIRQEHLDG